MAEITNGETPTMSIRAWETWSSAVVRIKNDNGDLGTGVLVSTGADATVKYFIVTAAHVISDPPSSLDTTLNFAIDCCALKDGIPLAVAEQIDLTRHGERLYRKHPREDVIAIDISSMFGGPDTAELQLRAAGPADFIRQDSNEWHQIAPGENVLVFGYPAGVAVAETGQPVVSQGHLATPIFQRILLPQPDGSQSPIDAFLIDASVMKGSSGSAVVLRPQAMRVQRDGIMHTPCPPLLLGIVSHELTRTELLGGRQTPDLTGLALVYPPTVIRETISLFRPG